MRAAEIMELTISLTPGAIEFALDFNQQGRTLRGYTAKDDPIGRAEWVSDGWACIDTILETHNRSSVDRQFVILGGLIPAFSKAGYSPYLPIVSYTYGDHKYNP